MYTLIYHEGYTHMPYKNLDPWVQSGSGNSNLDGDLHENMHVIIDYEQELFPGKITEVLPNEFVRVSCMEKGGAKGSTWK